jgi:hypothetical protein
MFTSLNNLISSSSRRSKVGAALYALQVRKVFADVLGKTDFPKEVLASARATSFKNGELTVKVQGLARAELLMRAGGLIRDINKVLGRRTVFKIKFKSY